MAVRLGLSKRSFMRGGWKVWRQRRSAGRVTIMSNSISSGRRTRVAVAAGMITCCLLGLSIALAFQHELVVPVLAIPFLAGLTGISIHSAWKLTRSGTQGRYALRRSPKSYLLLGALALVGAVYAVAASGLAMIGIYLVLLAQIIFAVYKEIPPVSDSTAAKT